MLECYPWSQCPTMSVIIVRAFMRISLEIRTLCTEDQKFDASEFHSALLPFPIPSWLAKNWSLPVFIILKRDITENSQRKWEGYFSVYQSAFKIMWAKEYYDLGIWYVCKTAAMHMWECCEARALLQDYTHNQGNTPGSFPSSPHSKARAPFLAMTFTCVKCCFNFK